VVVIFTDNSTFEFNGSSIFRDNQANHTGGGIYAARSVFNFVGRSSLYILLTMQQEMGEESTRGMAV